MGDFLKKAWEKTKGVAKVAAVGVGCATTATIANTAPAILDTIPDFVSTVNGQAPEAPKSTASMEWMNDKLGIATKNLTPDEAKACLAGQVGGTIAGGALVTAALAYIPGGQGAAAANALSSLSKVRRAYAVMQGIGTLGDMTAAGKLAYDVVQANLESRNPPVAFVTGPAPARH